MMTNSEKVTTSTKILLSVAAITILLALLSAFTRYIYAKDYYFFVEAPCDVNIETCFLRSCDDYCPPNGLETYKTYRIKASDYEHCTNNSCQNICAAETVNFTCTHITCDVENGDECSE